MTKEEMVHLLKTDVDEWNRWRHAVSRPGVPPVKFNLHGADFSGINLSNADLSLVGLKDSVFDGADLTSVDLSGADLSGSSLIRAGLLDAQMVNTNLVGAHLLGAVMASAKLAWATLVGADLTMAILTGAVFSRTWLTDANFSSAILGGTVFGDVDLRTVKGLETVNHRGPSTIGLDTLFRSGGSIPKRFLLDAGIPEEFIRNIPSLTSAKEAVEFYSCFISFSFKDEEFARHLRGRMRDEKLRVWFAPEDGKGGRKLHEQIETQIQVQDKLLLLLSEASMKSEWVATEVYHARQREIREKRQVLFPIALCPFEEIRKWKCFDADSGKDMAREVREYLIPDFSTWKDHDKFEDEFKKLLRDLKADPLSSGG